MKSLFRTLTHAVAFWLGGCTVVGAHYVIWLSNISDSQVKWSDIQQIMLWPWHLVYDVISLCC
jgi:hypothetical protein